MRIPTPLAAASTVEAWTVRLPANQAFDATKADAVAKEAVHRAARDFTSGPSARKGRAAQSREMRDGAFNVTAWKVRGW